VEHSLQVLGSFLLLAYPPHNREMARVSSAGRVAGGVLLLLLLPGCGIQADSAATTACRNGGTSCAAAQAPAGMRQVLKGHRMVRTRWVEKTNKESGVPDIGVKAEWAPIRETR